MGPWRTVFFVVNFSAAALFVAFCFISFFDLVAAFGLPVGYPGDASFVVAAVAYGAAEWLLYFRKNRALEWSLGVLCGLVGALAAGAFVVNAVGAVGGGGLTDAYIHLGIGAVLFAVAAYGLGCGWVRVRRRTVPEARGFPVGDQAGKSQGPGSV